MSFPIERRRVIAGGAGLTFGLEGCFEWYTDDSHSGPVGKVFIAANVIEFDPRGSTLYGQLVAEELKPDSLTDGSSLDPATGSFSISGTSPSRISFAENSLEALTIISNDGTFHVFDRGRLVETESRQFSKGSGADLSSDDRSPAEYRDVAEGARSAQVFASQEAVLFDVNEGTLTGQIGAEGIHGEELEADDEVDAATGRFTVSGTDRDRIRFDRGTLSAITVIAADGQFDLFYKGTVLEQGATQGTATFPAEEEPDPVVEGRKTGDGWETIDDFETGSLTRYDGTTGDFRVVSETSISANAISGSYVLAGNSPGRTRRIATDGSGDTPAWTIGEDVRCWVRPGTDLATTKSGVCYGVQDAEMLPADTPFYVVMVNKGQFLLRRQTANARAVILASESVSGPPAWYLMEVRTDSAGRQEARLFDAGGHLVAGPITTRNESISTGGIGYSASTAAASETIWFDQAQRRR